MFRFVSPVFFVFLLAIPLSIFFKVKKEKHINLKVSSIIFKAPSLKSFFLVFSQILPYLKYFAVILLIIALARPQWGTKKNIITHGINIILALDLSESMAALDFKLDGSIVTRLEAVKNVVNDFIVKRDGDRIGMVVFGSYAYTQIPLTRDYNTISFVLDKLEIGAAGPSTAIGDAIGISLKRIRDIKSKSNIIILLTDGKNNSGEISVKTATDIASGENIKIYTIGVGEKGRAPFLVKDGFGGERYIYQRVDMDHTTLKNIADKTNAEFFAARDTKSLKEIYDIINKLETTEVEVKTWAEYNELYLWFLISGFFILCIYIVFTNTRFLKIP
ncbi:MAG: magnesium chelatase [Desulfobacteraceae bacterium 4572_130]|nr:MAG: magnesium chelatase [Desulfobacteraceae bacterium 4572_130]